MADNTLSNADLAAKMKEIYELATDVQVQASRIESLADAVDGSIDFGSEDEEQRNCLGRAYDYLMLIIEAAKKVGNAGERLEEIGFFKSKEAKQ